MPLLVAPAFPAGVLRSIEHPAGVAEIEQLALNSSREATRLCDLPVSLEEIRSWAEYLAAAGFHGEWQVVTRAGQDAMRIRHLDAIRARHRDLTRGVPQPPRLDDTPWTSVSPSTTLRPSGSLTVRRGR